MKYPINVVKQQHLFVVTSLFCTQNDFTLLSSKLITHFLSSLNSSPSPQKVYVDLKEPNNDCIITAGEITKGTDSDQRHHDPMAVDSSPTSPTPELDEASPTTTMPGRKTQPNTGGSRVRCQGTTQVTPSKPGDKVGNVASRSKCPPPPVGPKSKAVLGMAKGKGLKDGGKAGISSGAPSQRTPKDGSEKTKVMSPTLKDRSPEIYIFKMYFRLTLLGLYHI